MSMSSIHVFDGGVIPDSESSGGSSGSANIKNLIMRDFDLNLEGETVSSKILCDYDSPQESFPYYAPVSVEDMAQWTKDGFSMQVRLESQPSIAANFGFLARVSIAQGSTEDEVTNAKVLTYERIDDHRIKFNILNFDKVTDEVTSINYLRLSGMDEFTLDEDVYINVEDIISKIPSSASSSNKLVTDQQLEDATASMASGYTPKGPASVSTLNGLTNQDNGDQYIVTDSGTLTDGSLTVTSGESVAWDSANEIWYKVNQYALKSVVDNLVESALHNAGAINSAIASTAPYNDLDTFPINEVAISINSYSAIAHKPTDEAFNVLTFGGTNGGKCQVVSTVSKKIYMRSYWVGSWSDWVEVTETDPKALHNIGGISAAAAADAPYNDLNTFPINEVAISINSYSAIAHKPTDEAFNVMTFGATNGAKCQIVSTQTNKMYMRAYWVGSWSDWVEVTNTDPKALHSVGGISSAMAAASPYNDLDTFPINEVAISINSYSAIAHKPTDESFNVLTFGGTNGGKCQIASTNTKKMFMRAYWVGSWSDWVEVTETDPKALHSVGGITSTMAAAAPYSDLDTFPINEVAISISSYAAIVHKPTDESFNVLTFGGTNGGKCQIVSTQTNKMFMRSYWVGTWGDWVEIEKKDETFIDVLNQFDNVICVGDSLTYGSVYTGADSTRQAKKTYPQVLQIICGNTVTAYANPGDNGTSFWNRWKDSFESKQNALAIIFLGTNKGFSDTLAADAPEGTDYSTWADTYTGDYAKIIARLKELGYRIALIKPWATGTTSGNTLETTHKVIDECGVRFGCAVIEPFTTADLKYHSYPDGTGYNSLHFNDFGYAWYAYTLCEKVNSLSANELKKIIPL